MHRTTISIKREVLQAIGTSKGVCVHCARHGWAHLKKDVALGLAKKNPKLYTGVIGCGSEVGGECRSEVGG